MNPNEQYQQGGYVPPTTFSAVPIQQTTIITNQAIVPNPVEIENLKHALRSNPQFVSCPYCNTQGMTKTESECSVPNVLCCLCTALAPWVLFQAIRGKDINCMDTRHWCIRCGNLLGNYKAC